MKKTSYFAIAAGRSAGHLLPALTLAQTYMQYNSSAHCLAFTTDHRLDKDVLNTAAIQNILHIPLHLPRFPYYRLWLYPLFIYGWIAQFITSLRLLKQYNVECIISTGGDIALPVCYAACLLKIPVELWELNVIPGKALQAFAPYAHSIKICFPESKKYLPSRLTAVAPYPLRTAFKKFISDPEAHRMHLGLEPRVFTVTILGGSQGSLWLNKLIKQWIEKRGQEHLNIQIIHQTGSTDSFDWKSFYKSHRIQAFVTTYYKTIEHLYDAADLIICRAGAGTLFEAVHLHKQCITIPLIASTTDHQRHNAQSLALTYPHLIKVFSQQDLEHNPNLFYTMISIAYKEFASEIGRPVIS